MKWTKFLLMTVLGIGIAMSSCSEDKIDPTPDRGDGQEESGDAYLALNFSVAGSNRTRSENLEPGEVGKKENTVTSVVVVLYNASTDIVYKQETMEFGEDGYNTRFTSKKGLKVKRQDYDLLILVNPNEYVKTATEPGHTKVEFESSDYDDLDVSTFVDPAKGIFMTNVFGYINVKQTELKNSEDDAKFEPISVQVERAVAKVSVTAKDLNGDFTDNINSIIKPDGVTLADAQWAVNVKNKSSFFMRRPAPVIAGDGSEWTTEETPNDYYDNRANLYAIDNNYEEGNASDFLHLDEETFKGQALSSSMIPENPGYISEYVLENTMSAENQYQPVTTSVLLSLVYTPRSMDVGDFYTYNGKVLSQTDINRYRQEAGTGDLEGLKEAIADALRTEGKKCDGSDSRFTYYKSHGNILNYYKGGVVYYNIPIRHFNNEQQPMPMGYGRYGVVRNNVYKMTINSISGPGSPVIDVPVLPDDDETWIGFAFEITPWYVRDNEIDL